MELISREALINDIKMIEIDLPFDNKEDILEKTLATIDWQPTVEAVPVVHCKDCKHWGTGVAGETEHVKCCEYGKYMVGENGYCVYGEKV